MALKEPSQHECSLLPRANHSKNEDDAIMGGIQGKAGQENAQEQQCEQARRAGSPKDNHTNTLWATMFQFDPCSYEPTPISVHNANTRSFHLRQQWP